MFDLHGPNTPPGTRAHIGVMIKVDSADSTTARIGSLGGNSKRPFDVMQQGRMAVCYDRSGAEFDVWQSMNMNGTEVDNTKHGAASWHECVTTDVEANTQFYCKLFGWTSETQMMGAMLYTTFYLAEAPVAGMVSASDFSPDEGEAPPHWGTYFTVDDAYVAAATAQSHGGTVSIPVTEIPGIGKFCGIESPQGVPFYVMQYVME
ncbi:MAG: VOC family protein, partial [Phycisphaerae bacterium]|nr:VOC family protein [Gemmatimonadaceae bacterium]